MGTKNVAPEVVILDLHKQLIAAEELDSELRAELTEVHEKLQACEVDWASAYALVCTRAETAEAKLVKLREALGTPGEYCYECCTMMGVSPHTPECEIGKMLEEVKA